MLKKVGQSLLKKAPHRLPCPRCEAPAPKDQGEPLKCDKCGFVGSLLEWLSGQRASEPRGSVGNIPPSSRIRKKPLASGGVAFEIPPTGKSGGLLFFGSFWTGFMVLFTSLVLFADDSDSGNISLSFSFEGLGFFLFFSLFWTIGLSVLYFGLRAKFSKHLLLLDKGVLVYVREFASRKKTRSASFANISAITAAVFYTSNYEPVYGVEIKAKGKRIRFGTSLSDEEKGWLVAELKALVFPKTQTAAHAQSSPAMDLTMPAQRQTSNARFELELPPELKRTNLPGLILFFLIAGLFLGLGFSPLLADAGFFRIAWIGLNSLFLLIAVSITVSTYRNRSRKTQVLSDGRNLIIREFKGNRKLSEKSLPLAEIVRVAYYTNAEVNNVPFYRAELVTSEQTLRIFASRSRESTESFVLELRQLLQLPEKE